MRYNELVKAVKNHLLPIGLLLIISVFVHHVWFFNFDSITHGDWHIDRYEKILEFVSLPHLWLSDYSLGEINIGIMFWPSLLLLGTVTKLLTLQPEITERILILWPLAIFSPLFMYLLAYKILKSSFSAFVAGIVFTFNTILIVARTGPLLLHLSMTFMPLLLFFFMNALETKKKKYILLSGFTAIVMSIYEFRIFYIAIGVILLYTLCVLFINNKTKKDRIYTGLVTIYTVIFPLVFNFYALFSLQKISLLQNNAVFDRSLFGTIYIDLKKVMTLFHYDWTGGVMQNWNVQPVPFQFFIIPLLAFGGYILAKNKRKIVYWALLAITMILLSKQSEPPFTNLYLFLFKHIPGFNAFRESGKFLYVLAMAYGVLIGSFVEIIKTKQKFIGTIIGLFIIGMFLWNTRPVITGDLKSLFIPRTIPTDYAKFNSYIQNESDQFRVLWVPTVSRWALRTTKHPMLGNYQLNTSIWRPFITDQYADIFDIFFTDNILDRSNIKYVILPLADVQNDDNFFEYAGKRNTFLNKLEQLPYLKKTNIGTKELVIFENSNYRPKLYATVGKEHINTTTPFITVPFTQQSSTHYTVQLKHATKPFYLQFAETYHPDWRIRVGEFNWLASLTEKNYFLPEKDHMQNDIFLNSFYIDPHSICSQFTCDSNGNGYDIELSIYFKSQAYVYLGLIGSALGTILLILLVVYAPKLRKFYSHTKTF